MSSAAASTSSSSRLPDDTGATLDLLSEIVRLSNEVASASLPSRLPDDASATGTTPNDASATGATASLLSELVPPAVKAGAYVEMAAHDPPSFAATGPPVPPMPSTSGCRVKAAGVPAIAPKVSADAATGKFHSVAWESSRERQWRLYGVWRQRGGRRQDEFKPKWR